MDRRGFLKSLGSAGAAVTLLGVSQSVADTGAFDPTQLRRVYRLKFDAGGRVIGEEVIRLEDLMPGDVFHMCDPDGTPVDGGVCWVCTSEVYYTGPNQDIPTISCRDWNETTQQTEQRS